MRPLKPRSLGPAIFHLAILLAGCVSTTPVAVSDAPIAVEKGSFYRSVKSSASYGNGVLLVRGEFTLVRSMSLPPHYVRIQVFGADDKLLAEVPAKLVREGKHRPGDPRLEVSFNTGIQIPLAQVVRIEVRYNSPS